MYEGLNTSCFVNSGAIGHSQGSPLGIVSSCESLLPRPEINATHKDVCVLISKNTTLEMSKKGVCPVGA